MGSERGLKRSKRMTLIENINDINNNIKAFIKILKGEREDKYVIERFHNFKYWYYIPGLKITDPEHNKSELTVFVPNNFLGWKDNAIEPYCPTNNDGMKGGDANEQLEKEYFVRISGQKKDILYDELEKFAKSLGQSIMKKESMFILEPVEKEVNKLLKCELELNEIVLLDLDNSILIKDTTLVKENYISQQSIKEDKISVINDALTLILDVLPKYICEILIEKDRNNWWRKYVLGQLRNENTIRNLPKEGSDDECIDSLDIPACLNIIERNWNDVFRDKMDDRQRTWSHVLYDIRNYYQSHLTKKILTTSSVEDISLDLAIMVRFMRPIDHDVADKISEKRKALENK